jgi:elongation factor Ts
VGIFSKGLLRDVSMQVAACPNVEYVSTDDIPQDIIDREKSIEMGRDDLDGKPDQMKVKIVEGRIGKRLKEMSLLDQPFIRDSSMSVADLVKEVAGKIGENVKVRRFTRYTLG